LGRFFFKQRAKQINYSNSFFLGDMSTVDAKKITDLFVGEVEAYEDTGDSVGGLSKPNNPLNSQAYSVGKKDLGRYVRSSVYFQDVIDGKTVNDFEDIKDQFHCHKDVTTKPNYLNLLDD